MSTRKYTVNGLGEFRVLTLRELAPDLLTDMGVMDTPERCAAYWAAHIRTEPRFNPEVETFWVLALNTRRRPLGCYLVGTGTLDTLLVHPISVFRPAIVASTSALILFHNHPSGDPTPSDADIRVTRELVRGGQLLKIDVLDHLVMGDSRVTKGKDYCSLRELGYFAI